MTYLSIDPRSSMKKIVVGLAVGAVSCLMCMEAPPVFGTEPLTPIIIVSPYIPPFGNLGYAGQLVETSAEGNVLRGTLSIRVDSSTGEIRGALNFSDADVRQVDGTFAAVNLAPLGYEGSGWLRVHNPDGSLTGTPITLKKLRAVGGGIGSRGESAAFRLKLGASIN